MGVLGIALPYALEFDALRRVGVKTYSILLSLDPAVAGLAGLVLLGQHLSPFELLGIARDGRERRRGRKSAGRLSRFVRTVRGSRQALGHDLGQAAKRLVDVEREAEALARLE